MVNFTNGTKGLEGDSIEVPKVDMGLTVEERIALAEKLERNNYHTNTNTNTNTNEDPFRAYKNNKENIRDQVSLLVGVGAMGILAENNAEIIQRGANKVGWKIRVDDPETVSLVEEGTSIQKEAMSPTSTIVMDETYWKARPKKEESAVEKENKVKDATSFAELLVVIDSLGVSGDIDNEKIKSLIQAYRDSEGVPIMLTQITKTFGIKDTVFKLFQKEKASLQEGLESAREKESKVKEATSFEELFTVIDSLGVSGSLDSDNVKVLIQEYRDTGLQTSLLKIMPTFGLHDKVYELFQKEKIANATSFAELFVVIDALGVSKHLDAHQTKTFIGEYRDTGGIAVLLSQITRAFGLRDKVAKLYQEEKALSTEGKSAVDEKGFIKAIENGEKMEKVEEVIEKRKKGVFGRLQDMGLKVARGYQTMKPRNKLMLGVFFAGISVATGGTASIVPKMFAAGSFGVGFYDKILKSEQEKGNEVNKTALKIRSALYGTVMAMGTSMLFAEVASHVHVDTEGLMNSAQEKVSAMKEGLKNLFGFSSEAVHSVPADVVAPFNPDAPVVDIPSPDAPVVPESVTIDAPTFPTSYTFVPGDNLTKVISEQVLAKLPETIGVNKETIIQNLLNLAADNPTDPAYATINQFPNPNVVGTGDRLNLQAIKELVSKPMNGFGGDSLIGHARKIASLAK